MLKNIIYGYHDPCIAELTHDFSNVAAIDLITIEETPRPYPVFIRPIAIHRTYKLDPLREIGAPRRAKDTISYKKRLKEIEERNPNLKDNGRTEKIINFINELYGAPEIWQLIVVGGGCTVRHATSIAKFCDAVQMKDMESIRGAGVAGMDWHNMYFSAQLAATYGRMLSERVKVPTNVNVSDADIESALRRAQDNHSIPFDRS